MIPLVECTMVALLPGLPLHVQYYGPNELREVEHLGRRRLVLVPLDITVIEVTVVASCVDLTGRCWAAHVHEARKACTATWRAARAAGLLTYTGLRHMECGDADGLPIWEVLLELRDAAGPRPAARGGADAV